MLSSELTSYFRYFIYFLVIIVAIVIVFFIIVLVKNIIYKKKIKKLYDVKIPRGFGIKKNRTEYDGIYKLEYPKWLYSNKDGSRNKVRKENDLIYYPCNLYFKEFTITTKYPDEMIELIHSFREKLGDNIIKKNEEEKRKYNIVKKKNEIYFKNNEIQTLIDNFRDEPSKFEEFCADLYRKMNYTVKVTPKVNDGGYDLILHKNNEKSIVECKCYALRHSIGRPLIQKLVGANQQAQADRMIFITTSYFTDEAVEYAKEVSVELINGENLMKCIKDVYKDDSKNNIEIKREDWELNISDIRKLYPPDVEI